MKLVSTLMIPLIVLGIIIYGYKKKTNIYDSFLDGAKEGIKMTVNIFPSIIAMIFAINIFIESGFIEFTFGWAGKVLTKFGLPLNILPMAIMRPFSGTATLAIMNDVFANLGPDSFAGRLVSTIQGCTDTTLYVIALYYASVKIKKIKYTLGVGLFADLVGIIAAFIVVILVFGGP